MTSRRGGDGWLDRRSEDLQPLLERLIAAPSEAGSVGDRAQRICGDYLAMVGYDVEYTVDDPWRYRDDAEFTPPPSGSAPLNLIATPRRGTAPALGFLAHVDTEPVYAGWNGDPFQAVCRDGRLHALGAADDKSGLAAAIVAAAALHDSGGPAPVVLSVHAKGGGARGTLPVFERVPPLSAVVYVHPAETGAGMAHAKHATRGVLDFGVTVHGWRATPREIGTLESAPLAEGGDAFTALVDVLTAVRRVLPPHCELNVGRVSAGDHPGRVPREARALLRVLFDEPQTADGLLATLGAELRRCSRALQQLGPFIVDGPAVQFRANPAVMAWDHPLCLALRDAVERVTGASPAPYRGHLASDLRFPLRRGIPAVGIGSRAGGFYGPDEWVDLDDLRQLVRVLITTAQSWSVREDR